MNGEDSAGHGRHQSDEVKDSGRSVNDRRRLVNNIGRSVIPAIPMRRKRNPADAIKPLRARKSLMQLYVISRRNAFSDVPDLERAAQRSAKVGNERMPDRVRWLPSYVVEEPDGRIGTVCIYQAIDVPSIREHARRSGIAADEISPVLNTVIVRQDPD